MKYRIICAAVVGAILLGIIFLSSSNNGEPGQQQSNDKPATFDIK